MKTVKILAIALSMLMLACQSLPDGFTPELWEKYRQEHPAQARVAQWIHEDQGRRELMRTYIRVCLEHGTAPEEARSLFYPSARQAMLTESDLRAMLLQSHRMMVQDGEELLRGTTGEDDSPKKKNREAPHLRETRLLLRERAETCLRRDRAILKALAR